MKRKRHGHGSWIHVQFHLHVLAPGHSHRLIEVELVLIHSVGIGQSLLKRVQENIEFGQLLSFLSPLLMLSRNPLLLLTSIRGRRRSDGWDSGTLSTRPSAAATAPETSSKNQNTTCQDQQIEPPPPRKSMRPTTTLPMTPGSHRMWRIKPSNVYHRIKCL